MGLVTTDQLVPFQRSVSVNAPLALYCHWENHPVVMQLVVPVHETPSNAV